MTPWELCVKVWCVCTYGCVTVDGYISISKSSYTKKKLKPVHKKGISLKFNLDHNLKFLVHLTMEGFIILFLCKLIHESQIWKKNWKVMWPISLPSERTKVYNKGKQIHFSNSVEQISNSFVGTNALFTFLTTRKFFFLSSLTPSCCKMICSLMFNRGFPGSSVSLDTIIKFTFSFLSLGTFDISSWGILKFIIHLHGFPLNPFQFFILVYKFKSECTEQRLIKPSVNW